MKNGERLNSRCFVVFNFFGKGFILIAYRLEWSLARKHILTKKEITADHNSPQETRLGGREPSALSSKSACDLNRQIETWPESVIPETSGCETRDERKWRGKQT